MDLLMTNRVALVTGGSSGIGRATALAFAQQGAKVAIASRTQTTGEQVVCEIQAAGSEAIWIPTDVSVEGQVTRMVDTTLNRFGRLDFAFNNAGSGGKGGWVTDIEEMDWDATIDGYLKSVWLCMKHEIPVMLKQGAGAIVNNSSVDGERAFPWDPVYSAAKHGVIGLTKSTALQYAQKGIRINAICPSWIRTPATEAIAKDPEAEKGILLHQPIGRLGTAEEVAEAVIWLCSEKASFILGTSLAVDGGYLVL
jgi:NAD(P)-dependent dehydrogenase (short-subunit alcohol dehydrogenase family)